MKNIIKIALTLTACCSLSIGTSAFAEESEKVRKARYEDELEKEAESTDAKCGTKISVSIDWKTFDKNEGWKKRSIGSYCDSVLGALRRYCEGANAKAYIKKKVKKYVCKSVDSKDRWALKVKGGTLTWMVPPDAVNADDFARKAVLQNL